MTCLKTPEGVLDEGLYHTKLLQRLHIFAGCGSKALEPVFGWLLSLLSLLHSNLDPLCLLALTALKLLTAHTIEFLHLGPCFNLRLIQLSVKHAACMASAACLPDFAYGRILVIKHTSPP